MGWLVTHIAFAVVLVPVLGFEMVAVVVVVVVVVGEDLLGVRIQCTVF